MIGRFWIYQSLLSLWSLTAISPRVCSNLSAAFFSILLQWCDKWCLFLTSSEPASSPLLCPSFYCSSFPLPLFSSPPPLPQLLLFALSSIFPSSSIPFISHHPVMNLPKRFPECFLEQVYPPAHLLLHEIVLGIRVKWRARGNLTNE